MTYQVQRRGISGCVVLEDWTDVGPAYEALAHAAGGQGIDGFRVWLHRERVQLYCIWLQGQGDRVEFHRHGRSGASNR